MKEPQNKIFAFISYNHRDVKWAKWLRRKLEWYRLPSEIHNEFEDSRYIRPVFRDRDELDSGVLSEELRQRLENSKYLIVICSSNSAQSEWVSDEVKAFIEMGRLKYIIPFIVDGNPQNYANADGCEQPLMGECFPKALRIWNATNPKESLLGIAVTDDGESNKQKAFIRVVSRMLGVSFDALWQRHKREVRIIIVAISAFVTIVLTLAYWFMVPVWINVTIKDDLSSLPEMEKGVLIVDGNEYSVTHPDTTIEVGPLAGYYRTKCIDASFMADRYYKYEKFKINVTSGINQNETINIQRDSTFAIFAGHVFCINDRDNLVPVSDVAVELEDKLIKTDNNGYFIVKFDIRDQSPTKKITIKKEGYTTIIRDDECPSSELKYIIHKR